MEQIKGIKGVSELVTRIETNEALASMIKDKPTEVLRAADSEIRDNSEVPNTFVYQAAVVFIGVALLVTLIGALVLLGIDQMSQTPEWVIAVTSAAIGALAGMLRP